MRKVLCLTGVLLFTITAYSQDNKSDNLNDLLPEMVFVEGGTFGMGCSDEQENDCEDNEKPAHQVTVNSFYIGKFEVTQIQWETIMGTTVHQQRDKFNTNWPVRGVGDDYPMYYVSWYEIMDFISRLNAATGKQYRLPTEAEWEFAARGGNNNNGYKYSGSNTINDVAFYDMNSGKATHKVGSKSPNELGIYDMSGNVWEWCSNWYGKSYYSNSPEIDPQGPSIGMHRIIRGGGWDNNSSSCRSVFRSSNSPDSRGSGIGFRLAISHVPAP